MHGKQRELLLFGARCLCFAPRLSERSQVRRQRWGGVAGMGGEPEVEIPWIVLCFMAGTPRGQIGSNLAACWPCIPRCSSRGVKYIEVMQENTLLLFYRASRAVSDMGEGRGGSCPKIKGEEESHGACKTRETCY